MEVVDRDHGRTTEGSTIQCYHGDKLTSQVIMELRPFQRIVTRDRLSQFGGRVQCLTVAELGPDGDGTRFRLAIGHVTGPTLARALCRMALRAGKRSILRQVGAFRDQIEVDYRSRVAVSG